MAFERIGFSAAVFRILLCSFFLSFISAEVESDILCLKSIKDSLQDPYDSLRTWVFKNQSKSDICHHFDGVKCNDDDQVFSIQLGSKVLGGPFPQGIANCSSLQTLDLSNNCLLGYIPSHVFNILPSLIVLDLSHNYFHGEIPASISKLTRLNTLRLNNNQFLSGYVPSHLFSMLHSVGILDLSHNKFSGEMPASIGNCTHLNILRLNNNEFFGYIPSHMFSTLPSLSELDLSYNKFSGEIPASTGNLIGLNVLRLNNNEFIGEIPQQFGKLTGLREFRVANNHLSGPVPLYSDNVCVGNRESYLNNSGLCGGPFELCDQFRQSFREALIAGYVFSATFVIVVYMGYFIPWTQLKKARTKKAVGAVGPYNSYIRRRREKEQQREENQMDKLQLDLPQKRSQSLLQLQLQEKPCQKITEDESLISFEELCGATDIFGAESIIGFGTTGVTYKARLPNGCFVAVKKLYDSLLLKRQFQAETMILERCKHRNIVPLLWFCEKEVERKERILVYQYMPNGRLSDFLSMRNDDVALSWPVRVRIALGIARGLCWLHHNFHVVHLSICSECILLDQNFEPKISNFGEAKFIHPNLGNDLDKIFYMDNQSKNEFGFEKMDVFNFGTVLLELLAGKRFNSRTGSFIGNDGSDVVTGTTSLSRSTFRFHGAIDKFLIGKGFDDEIFSLLTIASCCIQPILDQRPTMPEVYTKMSNILERYEQGEDFEMSRRSEVASATTSRDEIVEIGSI